MDNLFFLPLNLAAELADVFHSTLAGNVDGVFNFSNCHLSVTNNSCEVENISSVLLETRIDCWVGRDALCP